MIKKIRERIPGLISQNLWFSWMWHIRRITYLFGIICLLAVTGCEKRSGAEDDVSTRAEVEEWKRALAEASTEGITGANEKEIEEMEDEVIEEPEEVTTEELSQQQKCQKEFEGKEIGDYVAFGNYEPDYDESILWIILNKEGNNRFLLISSQCLDTMPYHDECVEITWEKCILREWLNHDFFQAAFHGEEQEMILTTTVANCDGGADTEDKVFILSEKEALELLPENEDRATNATAYAKEQGIYVNQGLLSDGAVGNVEWWLRGGADEPNTDMTEWVSSYGETRWNMLVYEDGIGVRPVIWVEIPE